jgi:hypothetical protein
MKGLAVIRLLKLIRGRPIGRRRKPVPRQPGMLVGQITIKPGFDELPEGFEDPFE